MEPILTKDIAIAVIGGSAAIASILLVFVGFVIMKAEGLAAARAVNTVVARYTKAAKIGLIPLSVQTAVMLAAYFWMFYPTSKCLFLIWAIGFPLAAIVFIIYSVAITLKLF